MAVVSRVATIVISGATGSATWTATAATQDTAAGSSVVIAVTGSRSGVTPPNLADTLTLTLVDTNGATIRTVSVPPTTPSNNTFFFTIDGTNATAARAGIVEIKLRATNTTGGATGTYDVETDGSPNTPPTGFSTTQLDRGYIRGTTTAVQTVGTAFGTHTATIYMGQQVRIRTVLGAAPYVGRTLTAGLNPVTGASGTSSTVTFDTDLNFMDNRWPAAATAETTTLSFPNDAFSGIPWTTATLTTDSSTADPRIYAIFYEQNDDNVVHTPIVQTRNGSHDVNSMLSSDIGYILCRLVNGAGNGLNGVTLTHSMRDALSQVADQDTASTNTQTVNGEVGWDDATFFAWTASKPGGAWLCKRTITAPANYLGLAATGSTDRSMTAETTNRFAFTTTLLAPNPSYRVAAGAGPIVSADSAHWYPGKDLEIGGALLDGVQRILLTPASSPAPVVTVARFRADGLMEYLNTDLTTWTTEAAGGIVPGVALALTPANSIITGADSRIYLLIIPGANTATWGTGAIFIVMTFYDAGGTPYTGQYFLDPVGSKNAHDAYVFDGAGFVGFPSK